MTTLSELITTLKGKMLPLTGGTLSGNLEIGGNATVSGKNIVRSINGTVAGTDGNVTLSIPSAYTHPATHPASMITGLATVATTGSYTDLSNKPSIPATPKAYVTSTYNSGSSWYRVWSDGFIEQGGRSSARTSDSWLTITLITPFSNKNYKVIAQSVRSTASSNGLTISNDKTTSSFKIYNWGTTSDDWYAFGY